MDPVNIYEAKTQLSKLVECVAEGGEEVIIARGGKPVARLTRLESRPPIRFGVLAGQITLADDFDAPLPEALLAELEGRG